MVMQVRKSNNESKVVPDASQSQRKQLTNYKRFEIRQRAEEEQADDSGDEQKPKKGLESVILSIDTGAKPGQREPSSSDHKKEEAFDRIQNALKSFITPDNSPNNLMFRAQEEYNVKPEIVHFRAREQPSLKVEINSQSIVKALQDLLSSSTVRRYADVAARKAAVVYRAFTEEMARSEDEQRPLYRH
ncbi:uncharacterized protein LOC126379613 [Pectinophora gossypiella]|uniref:uncharacterized protein LOC126379613 n=1 Tax=Pectinophora gossypiella TaxID=13191 RepID=UPI00214E2D41|nr:uncharacterized protein LOC126379613 [Pectinophora gossypiella]